MHSPRAIGWEVHACGVCKSGCMLGDGFGLGLISPQMLGFIDSASFMFGKRKRSQPRRRPGSWLSAMQTKKICSCSFCTHLSISSPANRTPKIVPQPPTHTLSRSESPPRRRLPLLRRHLRLGPVQDLQELCYSVTHSRVHVRLGALDVVVEVVTEELDAVDG